MAPNKEANGLLLFVLVLLGVDDDDDDDVLDDVGGDDDDDDDDDVAGDEGVEVDDGDAVASAADRPLTKRIVWAS